MHHGLVFGEGGWIPLVVIVTANHHLCWIEKVELPTAVDGHVC
jgi:hypothetical protein